MSKGLIFIPLGLFIDGLKAGLTVSLAAIAAFPGTIGGAAGGCAIGSYFLGKIGCWAGGILLGTLGSIPFVNGAIATVTEPIGIALSIAISFCLSATLGIFLVSLLAFNDMLYPKYLIFGGGGFIPGLNLLPFWTTLAILCVLKKKSEEEQGVLSTAAGIVTSAASPQGVASAMLGTVAGGTATLTANNQPRAASEPPERPGNNSAEQASRAPTLQLSRTMDSDIKPAQKPTAANDNERTPHAANDNLIDVDGHGRTAYAA